MTWDRGIEIAILLTLWIEFAYDAWYNTHEQRKKRRAKKQPQFEELTKGEHR
jgi:hypothetical protein